MLQKPTTCSGCPYCPPSVSQGFTQPQIAQSGPHSIPLLIVSEHAGPLEVKFNRPLYPGAEAGSVLHASLTALNVHREQLSIYNLIQCSPFKPDSNSLLFDIAVEKCHQYVHKLIEQVQPKAILALGSQAMYRFSGWGGGAPKETVELLRGYVLPNELYPQIPVLTSYHPSFLRQGNMALFGVFQGDVWRACELALGRWKEGRDWTLEPEKEECHYNLNPTLAFVEQIYNRLKLSGEPFSFDIENPEAAESDEGDEERKKAPIVCVGFCWGRGEAMILPFTGKFIGWIQALVALPNVKVTHNGWGYDGPVLAEYGVRVNDDNHHDTMEIFRRCQPRLPRSLQYCCSLFKGTSRFPWKHRTENLQWYCAVDCDNTLSLYHKLKADMEKQGIWTSYDRGVYQIRPICQDMTRRGMPIDVDRLASYTKEVERKLSEVDAELQRLYPDELKQPNQKDGYKKVPKGLGNPIEYKWSELVPSGIKYFVREFSVPSIPCPQTDLIPTGADSHPKDCVCKGLRYIEDKESKQCRPFMRWCTLKPFAPSKQALQRYVESKGLKLPTHTVKNGREKVRKETADDDSLMKLSRQTGDPIYMKVLEFRAYQKMLSTYCKGYMPKEGALQILPEAGGSDELFHQWGQIRADFTFGPENGQLATRNGPPLLTTPSQAKLGLDISKELVNEFKACVAAPPGYVLGEADYTGFHALIVGYLAEDATYMRLSQLGVHDFLVRIILGLDTAERMLALSDDELRPILRETKKLYPEVRDQAKRICIAEGQLVLTKRGPIPIEEIKGCDLLWDGIEWVAHDGLVCNGIQEVMTYDGLTATPDHQVWTREGRKISIRDAQSQQTTLATTGIEGQEVRAMGCSVEQAQEAWEETGAARSRAVRLRKEAMGRHLRSKERNKHSMRGVREIVPTHVPSFQDTWRSVLRSVRSVQPSAQSEVRRLRRPGNQVELCVPSRVYTLGREKLAPSRLQRGGDRPDRQQRTLRTGQPEAINSEAANAKHSDQCAIYVPGAIDVSDRVQVALLLRKNTGVCTSKHDRRADNRNGQNCQSAEGKMLAEDRGSVRRVRVYDILNAGPRHRFTVSGKLVSNCHAGGYGEGPRQISEKYHLLFNPSEVLAAIHWNFKLQAQNVFMYGSDIVRDQAYTKGATFETSVVKVPTLPVPPMPPVQPPYLDWWKRVTDGPKSKMGKVRKEWAELEPEDKWTFIDWCGFHAAKRLSELYHQTFPAIRKWQRNLLQQAGSPPHCIRTESGSQFWFFDVGHTDAKGSWRGGTDLNNVYSSPVQANAFQHIKEAMIELRERGLDEKYGMYLQLHDALHFCLKEELVEEWKQVVREVMERPSKYMRGRVAPRGLVCRVEVKVGKDGASKKEVE